jgi:hypothetical protein
MKVHFLQSGGLVGAVKGCTLDTAALEPEAAAEVERLVRVSGLRRSGEHLSDSGRDLHQYEITIEDGKRKVSLVVDDANVPPAAKALLGYLKKCARPQPPG